MLVGQNLGPFHIEKEVGSGAMGTVYLARYTKEDQKGLKPGQPLAIKIMAPGLGTENPTAVARFEREAEILKKLHHPNIVRLYGVGKTHGTRYYAMEYLEGESLDKVIARRGRMSWEEVVQLGKQLCDALYHAHQAGVVHRDLKPSNLMILADGTLKLTDFGIAKPLDVTALTSANCTVGTASYMSPEQCKGDRDINHKSDIYSLGIVFYELLTGEKPFQADSAMDMFMKHVKAIPERPSRLVLDLPVWLDNLICQMLEKKPEHRPLNAATVGEALEQVQERVEAQQSAGVEVARSRRIDRSRRRRLDDKDREVARSLADGGRGKRSRVSHPFYTRIWFQALGILVLLGGLALTLYLVLRPASPETLHANARELMASNSRDAHDRALDGPIREYLIHYRGLDSRWTKEIRAWQVQVELEQCNEKVLGYIQKEVRKGLTYGVQSETEKRAFEAGEAEEEGDADKAREKWQEILQARGEDNPWGMLAKRHLAALRAIPVFEMAVVDTLRRSVKELGLEPSLFDPSIKGMKLQALTAVRYETLGSTLAPPMKGDLARAAEVYQDLKEQAEEKLQQGDLDPLNWWVQGSIKAAQLNKQSKGTEDGAEEYRKKLVGALLLAASTRIQNNQDLLEARAICMNLVILYGEDSKLVMEVGQAKALLEELERRNINHRFD
jgi:serine/threonine protein kinase